MHMGMLISDRYGYMPNDENQVLRKLLPFATFAVVGHFAVVIWHLVLLSKVQPSTPWFAALLLVLANLLPVVGLFALAKSRYNLAAGQIAVPLSVALVIGGYTHFSPLTRITSSGCHPEH
jgi:hypothetical protein